VGGVITQPHRQQFSVKTANSQRDPEPLRSFTFTFSCPNSTKAGRETESNPYGDNLHHQVSLMFSEGSFKKLGNKYLKWS